MTYPVYVSIAGWADDTPILKVGFLCKKCYKVYSGNLLDLSLTGGLDETPENVSTMIGVDPRWSVMEAGSADDTRLFSITSARTPILAFSIEELSTIDFDHIPSEHEDD